MALRQFGAAAAVTVALALATPAHAVTEIQWWHAMSGGNNDIVNKLAEDFNASQSDYKVIPTFKGSYPDTMNAGIAAFRAGTAPHIIQVFEVGTATMMSATGAIKPVYQLMKDANEPFDPKAYLPTITGYYSTSKGDMLSFPFNSSSMVMWVNKDELKKAGVAEIPKTWPEVFAAAKKLKAAGHETCGFSNAWASWARIEQFSAWHNAPIGTKANGLDGFDTVLTFNSPLHVKHLQNLIDLQKDKTYDYSGRENKSEARFGSGECAIFLTSSGYYATAKSTAKFDFTSAPMPYYPDAAGAPQNSIIGGASLWVMGGKKPDGTAATLDGALDVKLATPKELGGGGGAGNNPEQLFAAGYAACFIGAMKFVASQGGPKVPADATVTSTVGIGPRSEGGFGLDIDLAVSLPGVPKAEAEALVAKAHQVCPYSNATRGNVDVRLTSCDDRRLRTARRRCRRAIRALTEFSASLLGGRVMRLCARRHCRRA